MNRFNEFVKATTECKPHLPIIHTCEAFVFREVLAEQILRTSQCKQFKGDSLLYFFYGRPAYRLSKGEVPHSNPAFLPVCIMLKPDAAKSPKRIAPFDTGAFSSGLFDDHIHPSMKREDFLLDNNYGMPARLVKLFYGSNSGYINGTPTNISIPPLEFEALSYYRLISQTGKTLYDDRRATVEIQCDQDIDLKPGNVLLIVLPSIFLDDDQVRTTIVEEWSSDVRTYSMRHCNISEYFSAIFTEVELYLKQESYIK